MRGSTVPWWARAALIAGLATGCNGPTKTAGVLDPLPGPVHVEQYGSPTPMLVPPAGASPANESPSESWLPPGGLSRKWRHIVIHHTASPFGSLRDIDRWHRARGWESGCGYHFVVGNGTHSGDGEIEVASRWRKQEIGAHTRLSRSWAAQKGLSPNHYNERGIGIVLVGDLSKRPPTDKQMASLARLVSFLMSECSIREDGVVGHGDVDQTNCPGKYFSMGKLMRRVRKESG